MTKFSFDFLLNSERFFPQMSDIVKYHRYIYNNNFTPPCIFYYYLSFREMKFNNAGEKNIDRKFIDENIYIYMF